MLGCRLAPLVFPVLGRGVLEDITDDLLAKFKLPLIDIRTIKASFARLMNYDNNHNNPKKMSTS